MGRDDVEYTNCMRFDFVVNSETKFLGRVTVNGCVMRNRAYVRLSLTVKATDTSGYRINVFVEVGLNIDIISRHNCACPIGFDDTIPCSESDVFGNANCGVDYWSCASLCSSNIGRCW